jgi:hypothetical protein
VAAGAAVIASVRFAPLPNRCRGASGARGVTTVKQIESRLEGMHKVRNVGDRTTAWPSTTMPRTNAIKHRVSNPLRFCDWLSYSLRPGLADARACR